MAIDLITGHQGVSHISADQIATINNAMMDNFGANKVMRLVGGELTADGLTITISEGYWRVNGFDMEIQEGETLYIDPTTIGLSRIDDIYVEILQDIPTGAQRAEIYIALGEPSATPTAPDEPTAPYLNTDILLQIIKLASVTVTEGAMVMTDLTIAYEMVTPSELEAVETAVADIVNVYGAKNLLPNNATSQVINGITFTVNDNGTVTASGTATAKATFQICAKNNHVFPDSILGKTVKISGSINTNNAYVQLYDPSANTGRKDTAFTMPSNMNSLSWNVILEVKSGTTVNGTFKPMIRLASIQDDTYEPYAETNQQLTTRKVSWDDFSETGSVNILENDATTQTTFGITFTRNANGSITCSGTATANITYNIKTQPKMEDGKQYLLKSFQPGSSANAYLSYSDIQHSDYGDFDGNGVIITKFDYSTSPNSKVRLRVLSGTSFETPMTFYPLLTPILDYNGDYVPYAKSNKELTDAFTNQVANKDDEYSSSKAYAVDDLCIYNNVLYKCITACSAAAWSVNQNCFSATTLTSAVTDFNNDLSSYAKLSGATFTGQLNLTNVTGSSKGIALKDTSNNTRAIRLESNGGGAVAFKMGAPLKSSYGVMEIGALNDSNGVHTYGSYLSVYNYAGSALVGVNASAFNVGSSRRYKENIQNMTEKEAKKLLDVDVVTFDYKADSGIAIGDDRFNRQGVIAEDVNNICPDVVTNRIIDGKDMIDSVDYSKFVPRLIKMVQIQEMRIKELEAKSL